MAKFKRTWEEIVEIQNDGVSTRKRPTDEEHRIQCACVRWFGYTHRDLRGSLFAVPNGGRRDAATGAKMKAEGVVPGVSDLILLKARNGYHGLCIEMKTKTGRQSESQKEWQDIVESDGYKYVVCRSLDDFIEEVELYLSYV